MDFSAPIEGTRHLKALAHMPQGFPAAPPAREREISPYRSVQPKAFIRKAQETLVRGTGKGLLTSSAEVVCDYLGPLAGRQQAEREALAHQGDAGLMTLNPKPLNPKCQYNPAPEGP